VEFKKDYSYFDTIQIVKYKTNNITKIEMSKIVGKENVDKVKIDEKDTNLSYDKQTAILNITSNNPKGFKYIDNTGTSGT
ncbi:hypothetical protein VJJ00_09060, partial [Parvimonas micra]|nr:hypothetical protein [Parvimonas micra]